jgi:hypothetical protein
MAATGAAVVGLAALVGCTAESSSDPPRGRQYAGPAPTADTAPAPSQPLLVDVDPNQTLETTPGSGLGVYVEYQTGGHWLVWWTCDSDQTGYACHYRIDASVTQGTLTNVAGQNLEPTDSVSQPNPQQVTAITATTSGADGVQFDATPGATLSVAVQVDADVYFFFVQDKKVNGGYTGALTNPLLFQPTSP